MTNGFACDLTEPSIADLASESVLIFDTAGAIQYWNPASEALYGWPQLAMVGRNIGELSPSPADDSHWRQLMQEGSWRGLLRRRSSHGTYVAVEVRQYVRLDRDGVPRDVVEYASSGPDTDFGSRTGSHIPDRAMAASWDIDISDAADCINEIVRLRGTGLTGEAPELHALGLDLVQAARVRNVNDRAARLVGGNRGPALMIGQPLAAFWPIDSRTILAEMIVDAVTAGTREMTHRRQVASDGILRDPVFTVWLPSGDDRKDRIFVAVNGTADDDRSYLYLRASEARYRKLVRYMPIALWQVDASHMGRIYSELRNSGVEDFGEYLDRHSELIELAATSVPVTDVNRKAVEMFGGQTPYDLMRPVGYLFTETPSALRNVMIARFRGQPHHNEQIRVRTFDGRLLDVQFSVTYPNPPSELDVTIFSMEDITERLRIENELRQIQSDYQHAARISMLGELTSSIAHEVNQPLAAIVTNAETSLRWLSRDPPNIDKAMELTGRVASNARRANDIVQHIRGMATKHPPERVLLNLNEVVQEALLFVRYEIESHAIGIRADLARQLPEVAGDRVQLQQVLVNMLLNSIQAMAADQVPPRAIAIRTEGETSGRISLTLSDTGPGIAEANLDRIFEGFFTTKDGGMGMGLALCQSIAAQHGGSIQASNRPDRGAKFQLILPAAKS